jgi:hypothetical protein
MFPIETTTLRARPWPAYLLMAISGLVFIPRFFFLPEKTGGVMYIGIGLFIFSIIVWFLLSKSRIIIDDAGLNYKTVFTTKEVLWNSVSKTYLKYRQHGRSGSYYWYFENPYGRKIKFPIRLYSRKNLRTIAEALTTKCQNADIERRIYDMAEGQFPWYIW